MGAFLTAFGVGGVVARYLRVSHPAASGIGVATGIVMATNRLSVREASLRAAGLERGPDDEPRGAAGRGVGRDPERRVGQVTLTVSGERFVHIARRRRRGEGARNPAS